MAPLAPARRMTPVVKPTKTSREPMRPQRDTERSLQACLDGNEARTIQGVTSVSHTMYRVAYVQARATRCSYGAALGSYPHTSGAPRASRKDVQVRARLLPIGTALGSSPASCIRREKDPPCAAGHKGTRALSNKTLPQQFIKSRNMFRPEHLLLTSKAALEQCLLSSPSRTMVCPGPNRPAQGTTPILQSATRTAQG